MVGIVLAVVAGIIVLLVLSAILKAVRIVQQGFVGVITRFGEFKDIKNPGLTFIIPFIEVMKIVDVRETPRTGDRQQVITRDNVAVIVNATIFSQVVDVRLASSPTRTTWSASTTWRARRCERSSAASPWTRRSPSASESARCSRPRWKRPPTSGAFASTVWRS